MMTRRRDIRHVSYIIPVGFLIVAFAAEAALAQTHYESLTWRPDGEALTVSVGEDLYTLPIGGGPAQRLTEIEGRDAHASWSPDGSVVAFGSSRDGDSEIYAAEPDGSRPRALTDDEDYNSHPTWSPDGRRIAFMKRREGRWQLWIMESDGSGARRLTRSTGNDFNPRWSPDGRWIVFESSRHEGDQDEIYVIRPDGSGERRLTETPGNDIYPSWSADGERIAYCTIEEGRAFVHVMPVEEGRPDGAPELLLEDACLAVWSPDGRHLAYKTTRRGEPDRLWVAGPDGSHAKEVPGPVSEVIR